MFELTPAQKAEVRSEIRMMASTTEELTSYMRSAYLHALASSEDVSSARSQYMISALQEVDIDIEKLKALLPDTNDGLLGRSFVRMAELEGISIEQEAAEMAYGLEYAGFDVFTSGNLNPRPFEVDDTDYEYLAEQAVDSIVEALDGQNLEFTADFASALVEEAMDRIREAQ